MGEYLHMLAQALLGVEKTDRNWCNGLYRLYCLHPDDVELRLASSLSCEGAGGPNVEALISRAGRVRGWGCRASAETKM